MLGRHLGKLLLLGYLLTLIVLITMPARGFSLRHIQLGSIPGDYVAHVLAFLPWVICAWLVWGRRLRVMLCFSLGVLTVVGLECLHLYIPQRGFEWHDMAAGFTGLSLSLFFYYTARIIHRQFFKGTKNP